ncbi:thermonuclease family protein [Chitinivorax sp. PXF-14]|uniref:thermonuclease family protein n=1 Tax=Chitinivorax sp. PXF-14 TaxID=3230488 RepID=UPI003466BE72
MPAIDFNGRKFAPLGWLLALALLMLACHAGARPVEWVEGTVVAVADGDTVTVLDAEQVQHKIRLAFIDAPEKHQAFGQRAKQALADRVFRQPVRVEVVDKDRYGRSVGRIWLQDTDINLAQLADGYAWHYQQYARRGQSKSDFARYQEAEKSAREQGLGLWSDADPVPPWLYRHPGMAGRQPNLDAQPTPIAPLPDTGDAP